MKISILTIAPRYRRHPGEKHRKPHTCLKLSAPKSHVTLLTSDTHQFHLHPTVTSDNSPLPLEPHLNLLGVTFNTHFSFSQHVLTVKKKAAQRLKILKALAGTNWGQQKGMIIMTYKALIWSVISYAAPVWFPTFRKTSIKAL